MCIRDRNEVTAAEAPIPLSVCVAQARKSRSGVISWSKWKNYDWCSAHSGPKYYCGWLSATVHARNSSIRVRYVIVIGAVKGQWPLNCQEKSSVKKKKTLLRLVYRPGTIGSLPDARTLKRREKKTRTEESRCIKLPTKYCHRLTPQYDVVWPISSQEDPRWEKEDIASQPKMFNRYHLRFWTLTLNDLYLRSCVCKYDRFCLRIFIA